MADENQGPGEVTEETINLLSGYPLLGIVIGATVCGLVLLMLIALTILLLLRRSGWLRRGKMKIQKANSKTSKKKLLANQVQSVSDAELQKLGKTSSGNHHQQLQSGEKKAHTEDQVPLMLSDLPSPPDPADKSPGDNSNRNSWIGRNTSFRLDQEDKARVIEKLRRPNGQQISGEEKDTPSKSSPAIQETPKVKYLQEPTRVQHGLATPGSSRQSVSSLNTGNPSLPSPMRALETPPDSVTMSGISSPTSLVYQPTVISLMADAAFPRMEPFKITNLECEPKRYSTGEPKPSRQLNFESKQQKQSQSGEPNTMKNSNPGMESPKRAISVQSPTRNYQLTPDPENGNKLAPTQVTDISVPETSCRTSDDTSTPAAAVAVVATAPTRPTKLKIPPPTLAKPKVRPGSSRASSISSNAGHYDIPRINPLHTQNVSNPTHDKPSTVYQMSRHSAASTPAQSPSIPPWERSSSTKVAPWDRHAASPSRSGKTRFTPAFVLDGEVVRRAAQKSMSLQGHQSGVSRATFITQNPNMRATVSEDSPSPLYNQQREGQPKKVATVKPNSSVKHSSYQSFIEHLQTQYGTTAPSQGNVKVIPPTVDSIEDEKAKSAPIDTTKIYNENETADS